MGLQIKMNSDSVSLINDDLIIHTMTTDDFDKDPKPFMKALIEADAPDFLKLTMFKMTFGDIV